jgi:uncharacterized protein YacL
MTRTPVGSSLISEALRLLIVIFGVGAGYQIGLAVNPDANQPVLGILTSPMIGVIVGAGLGYSLGGAFSRFLMSALDRGETVLDGVTPEELVAGSVGGSIAGVLMAMVSWPLFLFFVPLIATSAFLFLVLLAVLFGFRVGRHRRAAVLEAIGPATGVTGSRRASSARLIDTSVAIDGRIVDIVRAGFAHGRLVVCEPVLAELQALADAGDARRRGKGRRGLDTLEKLRHEPGIDLVVIPDNAPEVQEVDAKLIRTAVNQSLALLTLDKGLAKVAEVSGISVQDVHALSLAMRPPVQAGDVLTLKLIREGKEAGQAVGYLDDGTMLVVEDAKDSIGESTMVEATSILTTNNGRMVFAKLRQREETA